MGSLLPDGQPVESLLRTAQFFSPGTPSDDQREVHRRGGRGSEEFYHERWRHDKQVRSTHGVNRTGSCSWKVYVKDGIITWEAQQTDELEQVHRAWESGPPPSGHGYDYRVPY